LITNKPYTTIDRRSAARRPLPGMEIRTMRTAAPRAWASPARRRPVPARDGRRRRAGRSRRRASGIWRGARRAPARAAIRGSGGRRRGPSTRRRRSGGTRDTPTDGPRWRRIVLASPRRRHTASRAIRGLYNPRATHPLDAGVALEGAFAFSRRSLSCWSSRRRPREIRDITVPIGTSRAVAMS